MLTSNPPRFKTHSDINAPAREEMAAVLNAQLADTFDMFSQMKQAHWNVKGPQFSALHALFDEIATGLLAHVDAIAERVTAQGSRLDRDPLDVFDSLDTVMVVAERMADLAASTRAAADHAEDLNDMVTNDLLLEVAHDLDKWLWFLDAHLQV